MFDIAKLKQTLRELVTDQGMDIALAELEKHLPPDVPKYDALLQLQARHNEIDNQRIKNVVSNEQATLQYDKLRDDVLTFFSGLLESDFSKETAKKANMGSVLYRIPDKMQHQKKSKCIVRVAYLEELLKDKLDNTVDVVIEALKVSKNMEVKIVDEEGDGEYFEITSRSTPEQFLVQDEFTEWTFFVKPLEIGTYPLALIISLIVYEDGKDRKKDIVLERTVSVVTEAVPEEAGDHTMRKAGILFALTDRPSPGDGGGEKAPKKKPWVKVAIGVLLAIALGWLMMTLFNKQGTGPDGLGTQVRQEFDAAVAQGSPELLIGFLAQYQNSEFEGQAKELAGKQLPGINLDSAITAQRAQHGIQPVDVGQLLRNAPTSTSGSESTESQPSGTGDGTPTPANEGTATPPDSAPGNAPNGAANPNAPIGGTTPPTGGSGPANPNQPSSTQGGQPISTAVSTDGNVTPDNSGETPKTDEARWDNKVMAKEDPVKWLPTTMVKVKGGSFKMGCSLKLESTGCSATAEPSHEVRVQEFSISRFEVTQALWAAVMGGRKNPSRFDDCDLCPVEQVSWDEAQQFIKKLNAAVGFPPSGGRGYRLPTEAEWEYAARQAGKDNRFGDGTNTAMTTNFNFNSDDLPERRFVVKGETRGRTVDVFMLKSNGLGLFNMSGNVAEWCEDRWHPDYEGAPADGSAWLDGNDNRRVVRGGGWDNEPYAARTYDRDAKKASTGDDEVGFRLVW